MDFDRQNLDQLFQYCMVLCRDRDRAYDLLYQSIERYLEQSSVTAVNPLGYIRRIARNLYIDEHRREQKLRFEALPDADTHASVERSLEALVVDQSTLEQIWERLSTAERETLYYWAIHGMSATEIGLHLEQPRGSVLSRLKRIRDRIRPLYPEEHSGGHHD